MPKFRLVCVGWLLFVVSGGPHAQGYVFQGYRLEVNNTMPPVHLKADLSTCPNQNNYGKLEGGGKLVDQGLDPRWLYTLVYFPRGSQRGLMLQNNLAAINVFLAAEVRRPKTVRTFLKDYLLLFLRNVFRDDGAFAITQESVDANWGSEPEAMPGATSARSRRLKQRLQPYARPEEAVVAGNEWTVDINVLTDHGAVEHWLIKGRVQPLRIDSFLREPKEPDGTFYSVP